MIPFIILTAINTYIFLNTGKPKPKSQEQTEGSWTVFGTSWCGWTTKQLDYLKKKGIKHKFVDCEKGKCDGIDAFPQMVHTNGEKVVGYKEV
jgi:glutaredoxin